MGEATLDVRRRTPLDLRRRARADAASSEWLRQRRTHAAGRAARERVRPSHTDRGAGRWSTRASRAVGRICTTTTAVTTQASQMADHASATASADTPTRVQAARSPAASHSATTRAAPTVRDEHVQVIAPFRHSIQRADQDDVGRPGHGEPSRRRSRTASSGHRASAPRYPPPRGRRAATPGRRASVPRPAGTEAGFSRKGATATVTTTSIGPRSPIGRRDTACGYVTRVAGTQHHRGKRQRTRPVAAPT